MISEKWDEKVIELAKSLINCQSYSGHEDKAAEALKAYMTEKLKLYQDLFRETTGIRRRLLRQPLMLRILMSLFRRL